MLAPSVTRRLIAEFASRPDPRQGPAELGELTGREHEILHLVAAGLSSASSLQALAKRRGNRWLRDAEDDEQADGARAPARTPARLSQGFAGDLDADAVIWDTEYRPDHSWI